MKKAFTLVEVIISVVLILVIGTSAFFIFVNNSSNRIESFEEEILNAANLYISVETDDDGKNFLNGINSGGRGVILPLTKLVEKGYLSDKVVATIKEEKGDSAIEENHVLALLGDGSLNNDCSGVTLTISWDESYTKEVYLCSTSNNSSGGTDMPNVGDAIQFTFILDPRCTRGAEGVMYFYSHDYAEYHYGEEVSFPVFDSVCWNAKDYKWKSLFNDKVYEAEKLYSDFWNNWDPRDTVFTIVDLKLPTLKYSLNENGYEKNKYIPGDSQNNFVSYGGNIFRIFYYGDDGIKLLLDGDIGTSKFSNGDGSNYKDCAFHYYDSEIKLETKSYPDLGLSNVKILTQEQKGSKKTSTIKTFLYDWYYFNIEATTITKPIKMYYCTQRNGKKSFTSNLDNCLDKNEVGASIPTYCGLLPLYDLAQIGYDFDLSTVNWREYGKYGITGQEDFYKSYANYDKPYWLMDTAFYDIAYVTVNIDQSISGGDYWTFYDSSAYGAKYPNIELAVRPVIMLDSDVEFVRGTGTREEPYFVL